MILQNILFVALVRDRYDLLSHGQDTRRSFYKMSPPLGRRGWGSRQGEINQKSIMLILHFTKIVLGCVVENALGKGRDKCRENA